MKRIIALLLTVVMAMSMVGCGKKDDTLGGMLKSDFEKMVKANENISAQELADGIIANENIPFEMMTMPVEEGQLMGFDEVKIDGFKEAVAFSPMIGSIAFLGYVFVLEDDTDVDAFVELLTTNANPRWNICTEAEETMVFAEGNKVFFLMSPKNTDLV